MPTAEKKSSRSRGRMRAANCMQNTVRASRSSGLRLSTGSLKSTTIETFPPNTWSSFFSCPQELHISVVWLKPLFINNSQSLRECALSTHLIGLFSLKWGLLLCPYLRLQNREQQNWKPRLFTLAQCWVFHHEKTRLHHLITHANSEYHPSSNWVSCPSQQDIGTLGQGPSCTWFYPEYKGDLISKRWYPVASSGLL